MRNLPMPRPLILLVAFSLFSATVYGQEANKPSPAVKRILDEAVRAVKRNRVDFDKANQKPLGEARLALEELSRQQTRDGETKDAIATLQQIETLERDVMAMASGSKLTLFPAIEQILDQAKLGVMANRQAFHEANEPILSDARSALEELAKKQTNDGKTKEAIATLQQVEGLERDVLTMANAPAGVARRPAMPNPLPKRLEGKWDHPNSNTIWVVDATGLISEYRPDGSCLTSGTFTLLDSETAVARFDNGWTFVNISVSGDGETMFGQFRDSGGKESGGQAVFKKLP